MLSEKHGICREEADLLALPISSQHGFLPLQVGGWLEHLLLLLQKMFVCLCNYGPMFFISFLKSLESH